MIVGVGCTCTELGIALGLSLIDIEDLLSTYRDRSEQRQRLIETWYSRAIGEEFSRERLQRALIEAMASRKGSRSHDSLSSVSSTPTSPTSMYKQHVEELRAENTK